MCPAMPTSDPTLTAAIAEYLIACEVENKSPRTLQAYDESLRIFQRCVVGEQLAGTVATFAVQDAYRFLKAVADSGVAAGTRHRRFREVRAFFSWCVRMGYAPANLWGTKIRSRRENRRFRGSAPPSGRPNPREAAVAADDAPDGLLGRDSFSGPGCARAGLSCPGGSEDGGRAGWRPLG